MIEALSIPRYVLLLLICLIFSSLSPCLSFTRIKAWTQKSRYSRRLDSHGAKPNNPGSDFGNMGAFGGADDDDDTYDGEVVVPSVGNTGDDVRTLFDDDEGTSPEVFILLPSLHRTNVILHFFLFIDFSHKLIRRLQHHSVSRVPKQIYAQLEPLWANILTRMAIDTSAYYMTEFRDDVPKRWMMNFMDLDKNGWDKMDWHDYITAMIQVDPFDIAVRMAPPRQAISGNRTIADMLQRKKDPDNKSMRVMLQYMQKLEPRKIAHQILTVREGVGKEMYKDLLSIPNSNAEVARYARTLVADGPIEAERSRRLTRIAHEGGSTPLREKSFVETQTLIINIALDLCKRELIEENREGSEQAVKFLDDFVANITANDSTDPLEKLEEDRIAHRTLLEQLYYRGITAEVGAGNSKFNILTLSQMLMRKRSAVARDFRKIITILENDGRGYYKMIRDFGGFKKFDLNPKGGFEIVDLDAEEAAEAQAAMQATLSSSEGDSIQDDLVAVDDDEADAQNSMDPQFSDSGSSTSLGEINPDDFGQGGPFAM